MIQLNGCKSGKGLLMDSDDESRQAVDQIRRGINEAGVDDVCIGIVAVQIFAIAVVMGLRTESWWVGLGLFIGLMIAMSVPFLRTAIAILMPVTIAFVFYWLMVDAWGYSNNTALPISIFGGLFLTSASIGALRWFRD